MRFPRLSHLFHRRSKSDTALAMHPIPLAMPLRKAASATCIDGLASNGPQEDSFAHYISAVPLSIPSDARRATSQPFTTASPSAYPSPNPYTRPHTTVITTLMERIRELETELQRQYELNMCIPALNDALKTERAAADSAQHATAQLTISFSALQADLLRAQSSLQVLHARVPVVPGADDCTRVLAAENAALVAERMRHRKFIELMISAGGHKPVLDQAYRALEGGTEPEAALVEAIRESLARPESVWATLLEPVTGPRTQEEYKAQVRCTLSARKEARDWRKRATFWKSTAKEDKALADTVTPSPSDIPSIAEEISMDRRHALEQLMESRQNATQPLIMRADAIPSVTCGERAVALLSCEHIHSSTALLDVVAPISSTLTTLASSLNEADTEVPAVTVPVSASTNSTSSAYANLAPLASETFRAAHSIRSAASRHSSIFSSISLSRSLSGSASVSGAIVKRHGQGLSPSASASTQASDGSTEYRRRREISVPQESTEPAGLTQSGQVASESDDPLVSASVSVSEGSSAPASTPLSSVRAVSPTPVAKETRSDSSVGPLPASPSPTQNIACQEERCHYTPADESDPDGSLVIIMHSELDGARGPSTPEPLSASSSGSGSGSSAAHTPSPGKRSRLPVPVLRNAIRRLSISRPVLVDSTNAGTFSFATDRKAHKDKPREAPAVKRKTRAKTRNQDENHSVPGTAGAGSPSRPTKIPMGQRIQQNLVGTARRAVQKRKSAS